jgi:ABC-type branched-subunit amino acid transport system substrate-binding protein
MVACVQGDDAANRRIESHLVPKLRHQGFDAIAITDLFPAAAKYSPQELMTTMQRSGVDGIMEAVYSGEFPKDGVPRRIAYKYHPIKGRSVILSDHPGSLDAAFIELIAGPTR